MEKLPKELRDYLREISPHQKEKGYFLARLERVPFEKAESEADMIHALIDRGLIEGFDNWDEITYSTRPVTTICFPAVFALTYDGKTYRKQRREDTVRRVAWAVFTAILAGLMTVLLAEAFSIVQR